MSCAAWSPASWPPCTVPPPHGSPGTGSRWRRSGTPRWRGLGRLALLLADHWPGLHLDGQAGTVRELLAGFLAEARAADAELAALAADELVRGSLEAIAGPSARTVKTGRPLTRVAERARQAIELARRGLHHRGRARRCPAA